ncbi:NKG2-D type II integral membrane protein isoform X2 [Rhinolophus sinicus]|uniref:NKG2-D type II integral membrane protein isoform X2 n=1 Tax=Rhinolophus sinicus TaxID=89399 RepID=UPI003D793403
MSSYNYMMRSVRDQWAHQSTVMSDSHNYKLEFANCDTSIPSQKKRPTLATNTCGENSSPFFLTQSIAVAMGIRFIVMVMICSAIVINSLFNQVAPTSVNESKTWSQSQASCMSHNSSLLKIYSKEDQDFFKLVKSFHWMGLVQNPKSGSWQWEDGSILSPNQLTMINMGPGNCALYGSSFKGYTENCSNQNTFICMQKNI